MCLLSSSFSPSSAPWQRESNSSVWWRASVQQPSPTCPHYKTTHPDNPSTGPLHRRRLNARALSARLSEVGMVGPASEGRQWPRTRPAHQGPTPPRSAPPRPAPPSLTLPGRSSEDRGRVGQWVGGSFREIGREPKLALDRLLCSPSAGFVSRPPSSGRPGEAWRGPRSAPRPLPRCYNPTSLALLRNVNTTV